MNFVIGLKIVGNLGMVKKRNLVLVLCIGYACIVSIFALGLIVLKFGIFLCLFRWIWCIVV